MGIRLTFSAIGGWLLVLTFLAPLSGMNWIFFLGRMTTSFWFWRCIRYQNHWRLQFAPGDSTIKESTGKDHVDRNMTIPKGKTRYQFIIFIHEILFLFLSLFLSFPSHIKRIILCFVYSYDNRPSFIYPSLEEEDIPSYCVVDANIVPSLQPVHKSEICIASPLEIDHPCIP